MVITRELPGAAPHYQPTRASPARDSDAAHLEDHREEVQDAVLLANSSEPARPARRGSDGRIVAAEQSYRV